MRSWIRTVLTTMAVFVMACGVAVAGMAQPKQTYLSIGTSSAGGTLFSLAGIFSAVVKDKFPQLKMNGEITGGVYDNVSLLKNKKVELGFVYSQPAYEAHNGAGKFASGKITNFSGVASGHSDVWQLYTLKKNNIRAIKDLRGKRVSLGATGSSGNSIGREVIEAHGLEMNKDWKPEYISHGDGPDALRDGRVDAVLIISATPTGAVVDITSSFGDDVVFVNPDPDVLAPLLTKHPYWTKAEIPGGVYRGYDNAIPGAFGMPMFLLARNDVAPETVYWILRTIYESHDTIARSIDLGKYWTRDRALEPLKGVVPLHPGAEAYFREAGLLK